MAELKNPLAERVKKMAAILEAARKAGEEVEKEKEAKEKAQMGQPSPQGEQSPS